MILQLLFKPENAVFMRVCKGFENQGKGMKTVFVEPVTPTIMPKALENRRFHFLIPQKSHRFIVASGAIVHIGKKLYGFYVHVQVEPYTLFCKCGVVRFERIEQVYEQQKNPHIAADFFVHFYFTDESEPPLCIIVPRLRRRNALHYTYTVCFFNSNCFQSMYRALVVLFQGHDSKGFPERRQHL